MGNCSICMGLLLRFLTALTPRSDSTYDRLSTGMDVDVLDDDALLTLAAVMVEGFSQSRVGHRQSLFAWFRFSRRPSKV